MKQVTIKDIAREAGVSIASVSRALNGMDGISEENRSRILRVCAVSYTHLYKGVADGEYTVGLTFEQGSAQYVGAGAPVKTVYMSEGVIFRGDGVYIIKGCPNESNAQKFVDWLTSKDVQEFMNNTQYRRTIRKDVEAGDAMVPMDQIKVIQDDETDTAAHKSEWLDEFKELFTE